jgi:hypothetical protein
VTIFYSAGMLTTVYLRGVTLVYWVYPTMIAAYFVLRPTVALAINSVGLVALVGILVSQLEVVNLLTIIVTIGLVNLFAYIFAYRTGLQNKELHTAVELDFLTGVGNRRALERKLAEHAQERRPHLESSLLLLDLDHFKQIQRPVWPCGRRQGAGAAGGTDAAPHALVGPHLPLWRRRVCDHRQRRWPERGGAAGGRLARGSGGGHAAGRASHYHLDRRGLHGHGT